LCFRKIKTTYETEPEKIYLRFNRKIDETSINIIRKLSSISDLVAIKKTQLGSGLKLISKYLIVLLKSCGVHSGHYQKRNNPQPGARVSRSRTGGKIETKLKIAYKNLLKSVVYNA